MHEITKLLKAWREGDREAFEKLIPLVDGELRKIAKKYMRDERREHILQTTALVNEALIKLIRENVAWESRRQFYVFVARRMRQVLFDYARERFKGKRVELDPNMPDKTRSRELIRLEEALKDLASIDERKATLV